MFWEEHLPSSLLHLLPTFAVRVFALHLFFFPSCLVNSPSVKKLWSVPDIPSNLKSQHRVKRASVRQRKTLCTNIRPQHRRRDSVLKATICLTKKKKKGEPNKLKLLLALKWVCKTWMKHRSKKQLNLFTYFAAFTLVTWKDFFGFSCTGWIKVTKMLLPVNIGREPQIAA